MNIKKAVKMLNEATLEELLTMVDGTFSQIVITKSQAGWKGMFGTPDELQELRAYPTLRTLLINIMIKEMEKQ